MSKVQEEELAAAFVNWVKTFDGLSWSVNDYNDLSDGAVLFEIVNDIDPKWFKTLRAETREDNWVLKLTKLKKLYTLIQRYYEEVTGYSTKNIDAPNLNLIAKESDVKETMKLCSLIVTLAVQSPNRAAYIEKIQLLTAESQKGLMVAIERVMQKLEANTQEQLTKQPTSSSEQEFLKATKDHASIIGERDALKKSHQALMEEHRQLRYKFDLIEDDREDLKQRLKDLEMTMSQSSQSGGRNELILKTEIDALRQELLRSENKRHETETMLESSSSLITDLTRRVEDLTDKADEASRLKDQLDEYRHAADKLKKTENVIDKYKKKLEESADLRRSLKTLEEENRELIDRNKMIEEEYRKAAVFKSLIEQYRKKIDDLETNNRELIDLRNKYEYEYRHMRGKIDAYEMEKARDMEKIELMEDRLKELELGDGERLGDLTHKDDPDDVNSLVVDEELSNALSGTTMTQLKLRINELERELAGFRQGKPVVDESEVVALEHMLRDANSDKLRLEKDLINARKEKFEMESKLARYDSSLSNGMEPYDKKGSNFKELNELRLKLIDTQFSLDQVQEKGEAKFDPELESRIEKLEMEKEQYKKNNQELSSFLESLEGKTDEDFKTENIKLTRQNADRAKKIDQLKELIKAQHEVIETSKIADSSLKMERESHKEDIKRLKGMIDEMKEKTSFEHSLITAAWYDIGRRIQRDNVSFQRITPTAWLGQQRRNQESQRRLICWRLSHKPIRNVYSSPVNVLPHQQE
ncbi:hypothetical protein G9A89_005981 [Geosiphon pyriformis]|nr:hypothetical protein G9A89_005981 [Geosiphon pyriformis]